MIIDQRYLHIIDERYLPFAFYISIGLLTAFYSSYLSRIS